MSDLDNIAEVINDEVQLVEVVETNTEESQATPQAGDTEQELFFAEDEGDQNQPNSNMTDTQTRAAWHKERDKRKRKQQELDDAAKREKDLIDRIASLESTVTTVSKGAKPTMDSCNYDEATYEAAMDEWYKSPQKPAPQAQAEPQQQPYINEEAEYSYDVSSEKLREKLPDYDDYANKAKASFAQYGVEPEQFTNQLSAIAQDADVDIARAMYAFGRQPALVKMLSEARTDIQIGKVLKAASGKIKTRERKTIDTKPTPTISGGGPIDNSDKAVAKLREQWKGNPTTENFRQYSDAKRAAKSN